MPQETGAATYNNVAAACEGKQNRQDDAVIGPRMMDFQSEFEKMRYMDGFGLPAEGASPEGRLFRALNMSHYILIEHIDKAQKEMMQYVCSTVNKVADHTQNPLGRKLHLLERQIAELSKKCVDIRPVEPRFTTLPGEPAQPASHHVDPETEDNHSLQHLEVAILKLWAHIDKIKDEDHLRMEEKVERKEIEELLAGEILYHNRTMEKLKAKVNSMSTEVSSCWKEIHKLQDAMKELEGAAFTRNLPAVKPKAAKSCVREDPQTPTGVVADPQELLQKINEELEHLDVGHRKEGSPGKGLWDECPCDLCGKARAGKSAGVTVKSGHDIRNTEEGDIKGKGKERAAGGEIVPTHLGVRGNKTTIRDYLAALNFTILDYAVITNVTPTSPILQKWRDVYNRSIQGNQRVLEFMQPNGDIVILLIQPHQPSDRAQKLGRRGYGLSDEELGLQFMDEMGNVLLYDPSDISFLEIICPPGPYPSTLEEALAATRNLPYPTLDYPTFDYSIPNYPTPDYSTLEIRFGEKASSSLTRKPPQRQTQCTHPVAPNLPVNVQSQAQLFAPYPQVANTTLPGAELNEGNAIRKDLRNKRAWGGLYQDPLNSQVIGGAFETVPYHVHKQEAEAFEKDMMRRSEGPQTAPNDILSLSDVDLPQLKDYEARMKGQKDMGAAEQALHSDLEMHLATAPRLYVQADTTAEPTSSPEHIGPKPVEVKEVRDESFLPEQGSADEKEVVEDSQPLRI